MRGTHALGVVGSALLVLGCCLAPSTPPSARAPETPPTPLADVLSPEATPTAPTATPTLPAVDLACEANRAARDELRARIDGLRQTVGLAPTRRLEAASALAAACERDAACAMDGEERMRRHAAVVAARRALDADQAALREAEVQLFAANEAVTRACGE